MKICRNIESFTKHFPNLVHEQKKSGVKDIFEMESELNLPKKLGDYFEFIKEYLIKEKKIKDQKLFELINEKINDFIMSKIYNKIFPKEQSKMDIDIYEKAVSLF